MDQVPETTQIRATSEQYTKRKRDGTQTDPSEEGTSKSPATRESDIERFIGSYERMQSNGETEALWSSEQDMSDTAAAPWASDHSTLTPWPTLAEVPSCSPPSVQAIQNPWVDGWFYTPGPFDENHRSSNFNIKSYEDQQDQPSLWLESAVYKVPDTRLDVYGAHDQPTRPTWNPLMGLQVSPLAEHNLAASPNPETKSCSAPNEQLSLLEDWSERGRHVDYGPNETLPLNPVRWLGRGTNGDVHETLCNGVALAWKTIYCRHGIGLKERKEIEVLKRLSHEHVIKLVGTYTHRRFLGLLLWPVATCDLADLLEELEVFHHQGLNNGKDEGEQAMSERLTALGFADSVNTSRPFSPHALEYLHSQRIRHKDLKPSNVLLSRDGLWLADFGSSTDFSLLTTSKTNNRERGTPKYFAPEVAAYDKDCGRSADIFSLGCVFLEVLCVCLTGGIGTLKSLRPAKDQSFQANLANVDNWFEHLTSFRFRGEHELRRQADRLHSKTRKVWVTVDASHDGDFLKFCKQCRDGKKYSKCYNAAAHLRRCHFDPRKRRRKGAEKHGRKAGGGGGPPMDYLKQNWMKEVEELVSNDQPDDVEDKLMGEPITDNLVAVTSALEDDDFSTAASHSATYCTLPPPRDISLAMLIRRMLERDPELRPTASELITGILEASALDSMSDYHGPCCKPTRQQLEVAKLRLAASSAYHPPVKRQKPYIQPFGYSGPHSYQRLGGPYNAVNNPLSDLDAATHALNISGESHNGRNHPSTVDLAALSQQTSPALSYHSPPPSGTSESALPPTVGETQHNCSRYDSSFKRAADLGRHRMAVHQENVYWVDCDFPGCDGWDGTGSGGRIT